MPVASCTFSTMATRAVVGRGLRETGAALKHASGLEVCVIVYLLLLVFLYPSLALRHMMNVAYLVHHTQNNECITSCVGCPLS